MPEPAVSDPSECEDDNDDDKDPQDDSTSTPITTTTGSLCEEQPPAATAATAAAAPAAPAPPLPYLAPFNPTSDSVIEHVVHNVLALTDRDVLWDLGCGDGRCLIAAARAVNGLRCFGIESDPTLVARGQESLQQLPASVQSRVTLLQGDATTCCFLPDDDRGSGPGDDTADDAVSSLLQDDATALYLFLLPKGLELLRPLLEKLVRYRRQRCQSRLRHSDASTSAPSSSPERPAPLTSTVSEGEAEDGAEDGGDDDDDEDTSLRICTYMFQIRGWEPCLVDRTTKSGSALYLYRWGGRGGGSHVTGGGVDAP